MHAGRIKESFSTTDSQQLFNTLQEHVESTSSDLICTMLLTMLSLHRYLKRIMSVQVQQINCALMMKKPSTVGAKVATRPNSKPTTIHGRH